jgi:hypothetical protein
MEEHIDDFVAELPDYLKGIAIDFITTEITIRDLGEKYGFSYGVISNYVTQVYDRFGVTGGRPALQVYFMEYLINKIENLEGRIK